MPSKVLIVVLVVQFIFLSICFGPFQSHSNPRLAARPKMTLSWAQNIFIPVRKNRCFITITLKQTNKQINKQMPRLHFQWTTFCLKLLQGKSFPNYSTSE